METEQAVRKKAFLALHLAVFLFGFTAILGELISLQPLVLTWWRVFISFVVFVLFAQVRRSIFAMSAKTIARFSIVGAILAFHWLTFYWSIKLSNASITLLCLSTTTFMSAILEPMIVRTRFKMLQLTTGLIIIPAMALVVHGNAGFYLMGITVGLLSAFLSALMTCYNKLWMDDESLLGISTIELFSSTLVLSFVIVLYQFMVGPLDFVLSGQNLGYMLILCLACTNIAFVLSLYALSYLSVFVNVLTINLEPIYGIVLAVLLLDQEEVLDTNFYIGFALIMLAVFLYPVLNRIFYPPVKKATK